MLIKLPKLVSVCMFYFSHTASTYIFQAFFAVAFDSFEVLNCLHVKQSQVVNWSSDFSEGFVDVCWLKLVSKGFQFVFYPLLTTVFEKI